MFRNDFYEHVINMMMSETIKSDGLKKFLGKLLRPLYFYYTVSEKWRTLLK